MGPGFFCGVGYALLQDRRGRTAKTVLAQGWRLLQPFAVQVVQIDDFSGRRPCKTWFGECQTSGIVIPVPAAVIAKRAQLLHEQLGIFCPAGNAGGIHRAVVSVTVEKQDIAK